MGYPFEHDPNVVLMHLVLIPGLGGRNWLHRCHTAGTTSQHHFLSGASSTFACQTLFMVLLTPK
jgi:hypothetical protein